MDNLENLMTLKNDMKKKDWTICDFVFRIQWRRVYCSRK